MSTALVRISDTPQQFLCEICPAPGQCCRRFYLSTHLGEAVPPYALREDNWRSEASEYAARRREHGENWPFEPLQFEKEYGTVTWMCPKLAADGRCSVYSNRPELCRDYQPGSSTLCAWVKLHPPQT